MEAFVVELSPEEEQLRAVIEPLLDSEGFELVHIRLKKAQAKSLLALFIDTKAQKNGVILENLTDISRLLSDVLDASFNEGTVLSGKYDLEVSSPGLDRPLSKAAHFADAKNLRVKIRLKMANADGSKTIFGTVVDADHKTVTVLPESKPEPTILPFIDIASANIVFDFSQLDKNKKKSIGPR